MRPCPGRTDCIPANKERKAPAELGGALQNYRGRSPKNLQVENFIWGGNQKHVACKPTSEILPVRKFSVFHLSFIFFLPKIAKCVMNEESSINMHFSCAHNQFKCI